ncbi:MAG: dTDP-4-dehydrorhamnose 3,5-epimerase [bacterium]
MNVFPGKLSGVLIIEPEVFHDQRGYFLETWQEEKYHQLGLPKHFVQDNLSCSTKGVLRGLHFQNPSPQGKLISVIKGEAFDVVVDLRKTSPTFGQWTGEYLSSEHHRQLFVPEGFAHGFLALSEKVFLAYKCTAFYSKENEKTLLWSDSDLGIRWPLTGPTISPKDLQGKRLKDFLDDELF